MTTSSPFELTLQNLIPYLAGRGLAGNREAACVRELGGGVSNIVLLVEWPGEPERRWVVKQSLDKLRVEDDWRSERARIFREAEAIQSLQDALGRSSLPQIVAVDRENYLYVMTAAPAGSEVWKALLLAGKVEMAVAQKAGELLAKMMNAGNENPALQEIFSDRTVFDQLRIDPYYRTTATRHPEMRSAYEQLIADSWNIRTALVHGDYSPKNILVKETGVFLIDFEVVHWGDPAFDSGFLLNHLFLKAFYQPRYAALYFQAAREFWRSLVEGISLGEHPDFERMTVRHLGGLMLARIDGKSPVEYIREDALKERVRQVAKSILQEPPASVGAAIALGANSADSLAG